MKDFLLNGTLLEVSRVLVSGRGLFYRDQVTFLGCIDSRSAVSGCVVNCSCQMLRYLSLYCSWL